VLLQTAKLTILIRYIYQQFHIH